FRCLAGRAPFEAGTSHELLAAILHQPAPRLREFAPVPRALDELVAQMLDKTPARRPADGRAAWAALSLLGASPGMAGSATMLSSTVSRPGPAQRTVLSSVAVLPFLDMSAGRDQGYFCEGIADELINTLTQVQGMRVAARSSSFALRSADSDARTIGRRLGVDAGPAGGGRKSGDRLRVPGRPAAVPGGS